MHCSNCQTNIEDGLLKCPVCGAYQTALQTEIRKSSDLEDTISIPCAIASALIFPLGFILYFIWKRESPIRSRWCLYPALASAFIQLVIKVFDWFL